MAKKAKKNHIGILSKMLARFAVDAEPEDLEEAVDAVEEITGTAEAPVAPADPEEIQDEDPEADPMEARIKALEDGLAALRKGQDEDEPEEKDPLARLEEDLDALEGEEQPEEDPVNPDEDPAEQESHFVDPEEINEQDEDETEEEIVAEEESEDCKARDAVRDMARAMKPFIAKLPKAEQKKAVDALSARLRKAYGKPAKAENNGYSKLLTATRKKAGDSRKNDPTDLGKSIMANRNPNYTK